jgi:hypothetical protein
MVIANLLSGDPFEMNVVPSDQIRSYSINFGSGNSSNQFVRTHPAKVEEQLSAPLSPEHHLAIITVKIEFDDEVIHFDLGAPRQMVGLKPLCTMTLVDLSFAIKRLSLPRMCSIPRISNMFETRSRVVGIPICHRTVGGALLQGECLNFVAIQLHSSSTCSQPLYNSSLPPLPSLLDFSLYTPTECLAISAENVPLGSSVPTCLPISAACPLFTPSM